MAGPSENTYPSGDVFPGEWPPVGDGPSAAAIAPYVTHVRVTPVASVAAIAEYSTFTVIASNEASVVLITLLSTSDWILMADKYNFEIKRNDTWRPLEAQLRNRDGSPIDLTDADTVRLRMKSDTRTITTGAVEIV